MANPESSKKQRRWQAGKSTEIEHTDIAIIGGGGSGLAAAVAACQSGAQVLVLEKRKMLGGNSAIAGGLFAAGSHIQKRMRINAEKDLVFKIAMHYSHWKINPKIFRAFIEKSGDTIRWLEEMGVIFEDVPHFLPNQVPRVFHLPRGRGASIVKALTGKCKELGAKILLETPVRKIIRDKRGIFEVIALSKVKGELTFTAEAVIFATGGYAGNTELLKMYYPHYTPELHLAGLPHMGDGLLMAMEIGAATEGLGFLMLRGPYYPGSLDITTVAMEPQTVWVNKRGERFVDEGVSFNWPEAANALNRQPRKISFALFDEKIKRSFEEEGLIKGYSHFAPGSKMVGLEKKLIQESRKGKIRISRSLDEIATWIGASPEVLNNTIMQYNKFCDQGYDSMFFKDRRFLIPLNTPPYYAIPCVQSFYTTMGGIKINERMEVVDPENYPIPGLYAVGNDTGGWESDTYCLLLSGSAFGFAINSGRIAGENAAGFVQQKKM